MRGRPRVRKIKSDKREATGLRSCIFKKGGTTTS